MLSDSRIRVSRGTYCTPVASSKARSLVPLVVEDPHPERQAAEGHPASDPPQTDDPVRLAVEFDVGPDQVEPFLPPAPLDRTVAPDDVLGERKQQRHGELGHGIGRHIGDVGDEDAALRGGLHIHDVHPHALPGDVFQPRGRLDEPPGDTGFDADQERIRIPKLLQQDRLRAVIQNGDPGDLPQRARASSPASNLGATTIFIIPPLRIHRRKSTPPLPSSSRAVRSLRVQTTGMPQLRVIPAALMTLAHLAISLCT